MVYTVNEEKLLTLITKRNKTLNDKLTILTRHSIKRMQSTRKILKTEMQPHVNNPCITEIWSDMNGSTTSQRGTELSWNETKLLHKGLHKLRPTVERMKCKKDGSKWQNSARKYCRIQQSSPETTKEKKHRITEMLKTY